MKQIKELRKLLGKGKLFQIEFSEVGNDINIVFDQNTDAFDFPINSIFHEIKTINSEEFKTLQILKNIFKKEDLKVLMFIKNKVSFTNDEIKKGWKLFNYSTLDKDCKYVISIPYNFKINELDEKTIDNITIHINSYNLLVQQN